MKPSTIARWIILPIVLLIPTCFVHVHIAKDQMLGLYTGHHLLLFVVLLSISGAFACLIAFMVIWAFILALTGEFDQ